MKRTIGILALVIGLSLAFLPACCVQAEGTASAITTSVQTAASVTAEHELFRMTNASVGPWTPSPEGKELDAARRAYAAYVRDKWQRAAKMVSFEVAHTPQDIQLVYEAFGAAFGPLKAQILEQGDNGIDTLAIRPLDEDNAQLILVMTHPMGREHGTVVSIADLERQNLENEG